MFKYLNRNPLDLKEEDCVTRAISLASGYGYSEIQDKLYYVSQLLECERLCVCCYSALLDDIFKYPRVRVDEYISVGEFAEEHPNGIFLIRVDGHLTCVINGIIYDLWDCSNELVDIVWYIDKRLHSD